MAEGSDTHRLVTQDHEDGSRTIAVVRRGKDTDHLTDEEIIAELDAWKAQRHLRAVDE